MNQPIQLPNPKVTVSRLGMRIIDHERPQPLLKGSSAKRVGKKPRQMGENPFISRVFCLLFGAKNLA